MGSVSDKFQILYRFIQKTDTDTNGQNLLDILESLHHAHWSLEQCCNKIEEQRENVFDGDASNADGSDLAKLRVTISQRDEEIEGLKTMVETLTSKMGEAQKSGKVKRRAASRVSNVARLSKTGRVYEFPGSYSTEDGGPTTFDVALNRLRLDVLNLERTLFKSIGEYDGPATMKKLGYEGLFLVRPGHVHYAAKAAVFHSLFEGFENEGFNTRSGVTPHVDPIRRAEEFWKYWTLYEDRDGIAIEDRHFDEFCNMKLQVLLRRFAVRLVESDNAEIQVPFLEKLGGDDLVKRYLRACREVWLLHKLAFSFEPPASVFRVQRGIDIEAKYMETAVTLDESDKIVNKVGFMIAPGLRLRSIVFPCTVYPAGVGQCG